MPDFWRWRYDALDKLDSYCHAHEWVPYSVQSRVCDLFDSAVQGGGCYKRLRRERKASDANR